MDRKPRLLCQADPRGFTNLEALPSGRGQIFVLGREVRFRPLFVCLLKAARKILWY